MSYESMAGARPTVWKMGGTILVKVLLAAFCSAVLLFSTIMFFQYDWLLWIMEVIVLAILIGFVASPMNIRGSKDRGYYERNNLKPDKLYGLKAGLISAIPFYLLTVLTVLMHFGVLPDWFFGYRVINAFFWPFISLIVPSNAGVIDFDWYYFLIFFLLNSIVPLTCHISYTLGLKRISVSDRFVYKKAGKAK